jgi:hypothetical protein
MTFMVNNDTLGSTSTLEFITEPNTNPSFNYYNFKLNNVHNFMKSPNNKLYIDNITFLNPPNISYPVQKDNIQVIIKTSHSTNKELKVESDMLAIQNTIDLVSIINHHTELIKESAKHNQMSANFTDNYDTDYNHNVQFKLRTSGTPFQTLDIQLNDFFVNNNMLTFDSKNNKFIYNNKFIFYYKTNNIWNFNSSSITNPFSKYVEDFYDHPDTPHSGPPYITKDFRRDYILHSTNLLDNKDDNYIYSNQVSDIVCNISYAHGLSLSLDYKNIKNKYKHYNKFITQAPTINNISFSLLSDAGQTQLNLDGIYEDSWHTNSGEGPTIPNTGSWLREIDGKPVGEVAFDNVRDGNWFVAPIIISNSFGRYVDLSQTKQFTMTYTADNDFYLQIRPVGDAWNGGNQQSTKMPKGTHTQTVKWNDPRWGIMFTGSDDFTYKIDKSILKYVQGFVLVGDKKNKITVTSLKILDYIPPLP